MEIAMYKKKISQEIIQQIHEFVMNGILNNPGQYRTENVAITDAKIRFPSYLKIVKLMDEYIQNIEKLKLKTINKGIFYSSLVCKNTPIYRWKWTSCKTSYKFLSYKKWISSNCYSKRG